MDPSVWDEIEDLHKLGTRALCAKYQELFGVVTASRNKQFLFRRIAWRLQARAEGDLNERARRRAAEIADDADVRLRPPQHFAAEVVAPSPRAARQRWQRDWRLPQPGTELTRHFRGRSVIVHVREDGFEYQGQHYRSLSAIAREVTGTRWNGLAFFRLTERRDA